MIQKITLVCSLVFVILFSSCVSSKKYKAATTEAQNAKTANEELTRKNSELQTQLNGSMSSNKMLTDERDRYQKASDSAGQQLKQMQNKFIAKYDFDGRKCMELRQQWWQQGGEEKWTFLFYHDIKTPVFGF